MAKETISEDMRKFRESPAKDEACQIKIPGDDTAKQKQRLIEDAC
jgi:hypothetical protein